MPSILPLRGFGKPPNSPPFSPLGVTKVVEDFDRILARTSRERCSLKRLDFQQWWERCEIIGSEALSAISRECTKFLRWAYLRCKAESRSARVAFTRRVIDDTPHACIFAGSTKGILAVVCMQPARSTTLINADARGATRVFAEMRDPLSLIILRWRRWS